MERLELENWIQETLASGGGPEKSLALAVQDLLWELTAERQARVAAEETLDFYKASADAMPNPIFIKDEDLRVVFFNRAYRDFFGLAEGENIGKRVQDLDYLSPEDRCRYHAEDSEMVRSLSVMQYDTVYEIPGQGETAALYWSKGFPVPSTGRRGLVGEIVDISKEKETQRELSRNVKALEGLMRDVRNASNTDPLTKLYNRNIMAEELPAVLDKAEELGQPVCLMLIDVDYFKQINDTYGHLFGDEVLCRFAQTIRETFRQNDIAVRYGGDEFLLLLPGTSVWQAQAVGERFRRRVCEALDLPEGSCVTPSIGVAQRHRGDDLPTLMARADQALYEAKNAGRNCVRIQL